MALSHTEKPTTSAGITSGVNCTRLYSRPMALEKARAKVVLPTPGLSSSRMWPRAKMAMSTLHTTASFPRMALRTSFTTASALGCSINVPLLLSRCPRGGRILILHRL